MPPSFSVRVGVPATVTASLMPSVSWITCPAPTSPVCEAATDQGLVLIDVHRPACRRTAAQGYAAACAVEDRMHDERASRQPTQRDVAAAAPVACDIEDLASVVAIEYQRPSLAIRHLERQY